MLVHAAARRPARPGNPLPCADLTTGPFGGPEYGPPDVVTSHPNPNGPGFTPGVPAAAIPGEMPPDMPGAPVPLPPAPPGARTVPPGPLPPDRRTSRRASRRCRPR